MRNIALKDGVISWSDLGSSEEALLFFQRQQREVADLTRNALSKFG
jgi:hypothetical protein